MDDGSGKCERSASLSRLCFFHGDGCVSCVVVVGVAERVLLNADEKEVRVLLLVAAAVGLSLLPLFLAVAVSALRGVAGSGDGSAV